MLCEPRVGDAWADSWRLPQECALRSPRPGGKALLGFVPRTQQGSEAQKADNQQRMMLFRIKTLAACLAVGLDLLLQKVADAFLLFLVRQLLGEAKGLLIGGFGLGLHLGGSVGAGSIVGRHPRSC